MENVPNEKIWKKMGMSRRAFLRHFGIAAGALTLSPYFMERLGTALAQLPPRVRVYVVKNGDCFQNTAKLWDLLGGVTSYIDPDDCVVIKGNGQWPRQGYTHTGCIKGVIDKILDVQGFSGEVLICDNVQECGGPYGFTADDAWQRSQNWPDHNWTTLAAEYQGSGKPVGAKQWLNSQYDINGPADGEGWIRDFFSFHGLNTYLSYPVFESVLTSGRMIDLRHGVWENGAYSGQKVKTIFMPNLNNHGSGAEDYAGVTSAIKGFLGATEIHSSSGGFFRDHADTHRSSFGRNKAEYAGELAARYINTMCKPDLYITAAMWSGHESRIHGAVETKTVLACENPATLDYVAAKYVISPYASWLDPDQDNNTRKQILGCISGGIGTIDPDQFEIISYDFENPGVHRIDIDHKIKQFKAGTVSEQEVKDLVNQYMEQP